METSHVEKFVFITIADFFVFLFCKNEVVLQEGHLYLVGIWPFVVDTYMRSGQLCIFSGHVGTLPSPLASELGGRFARRCPLLIDSSPFLPETPFSAQGESY